MADRIAAMIGFVATADAGSFAAAARRLGRSPAAITRAIAMLEARLGTPLFRRTTRVVRLTEAGERYLVACRRILGELDEAEQRQDHVAPRGTLAVTAPAMFGRLHVRPLADALLAAHPDVNVRLVLVDRVVNLIDEGLDVAIRIGHLPDSSLIAVRVGEVSRVTCAARSYVKHRGQPATPAELASHTCIAISQLVWTYVSPAGRPIHAKLQPRLVVNDVGSAIDAAVAGGGVVQVLSYQIAGDRRLVRLLAGFEPPPMPVHVVYPIAAARTAKLRAFVDLAVPALRRVLG